MERMCTVCMYRRILCKEVNALNKVFEAIASWWEWMVSIAMNFQFVIHWTQLKVHTIRKDFLSAFLTKLSQSYIKNWSVFKKQSTQNKRLQIFKIMVSQNILFQMPT